MDAPHHEDEDRAGRLYGLLIRLENRLGSDLAAWIHEVIEVGEYGLALEDLAGRLAYAGTPVTDQERDDMLALARSANSMTSSGLMMVDMVTHALGLCPRAG
jgi:hypothetical protein